MKKHLSLFVIVLLFLTAYALYASQSAAHRGELMPAFILMVIAVIFWKRLQKSS